MSTYTVMTVHHRRDGNLPVLARYFLPIQGGRARAQEDLGITGDDTGRNISHKNHQYSELTACYWALHNVRSDYIGVMHYRRIFAPGLGPIARGRLALDRYARQFVRPIWPRRYALDFECSARVRDVDHACRRLKEFLDQRLAQFDLVLPRPMLFLNQTVAQQFDSTHDPRDWRLARDAVLEMDTSYARELDAVEAAGAMYARNMFIARRSFFVEYHTFLFDVLDRVESRIDLAGRNAFQTRVFGFLSERLFNVYLARARARQSLRIFESPIAFLE